MKIDIRIKQSLSDKEISRQVARMIRLVLGRYSTSIQSITIRITDTNSRQGGVNIRGVVSMKLISVGEIVIQNRGVDVFSGLNHFLSRADRTINRLLERRRNTAKVFQGESKP